MLHDESNINQVRGICSGMKSISNFSPTAASVLMNPENEMVSLNFFASEVDKRSRKRQTAAAEIVVTHTEV
jgi:hypothetical protein